MTNFGPLADIPLNDNPPGGTGEPRFVVRAVQDAQYTVSFQLVDMGTTPGYLFQAWMAFRHLDANNKYALYIFGDHVEFRLHLPGSGTHIMLGSAPFSVTQGVSYNMMLVMDQYTFSLYSDGVLVLEVTDPRSAILSGPQLVLYAAAGTNVCWENLTGQEGALYPVGA